jgi:hypothetical protein
LTGRSPAATFLNINATKDSGERFHSGNRGGRSVWFDWTAPVSGTYRIATAGSTVIYSDQVDMDTLLSVYSGSQHTSLSPVAESDDRNQFDQTSEVVIVAEAGTRYWIAVDGRNPTFGDSIDPELADQGFIQLAVTPVESPLNDAFAEAVEISSLPYQTVTPVAAATVEPGEPTHDGKRKRSVWYRWTAPRDGAVVAGTNGNQYDNFRATKTGIAVYTGSTVDALTRVSLSPGFPRPGGNGARVLRFNAVAGTTYHFATDDAGTAAASNLAFFLDYAPVNDAFEEATVLRGSRVTAFGHNVGAGAEPAEPVVPDGSYINPDSRPDPASVWWRWTAPASGSARIDTFGSQIYSVMAVYTGDSLGNLVTTASRDSSGRDPVNGADRARSGTAFLNLTVTAGTTYHIQVYGDYYDRSSQGPITLSIEAPRGAPSAPESLTLTPVGPQSVFLEWPGVPDAAFFRIERRENDQQPWSGIGSLITESSVTDTGLTADTSWVYRIRAENESGSSEWTYAGPVTTLRNELEAWRFLHFERIDNAGLAANNADPDEDGLPNAVEFWLGLNPETASRFPAFIPIRSGDLFSWELPPVPEPLQFSLVGSANLTDWSPLPASAVSGNPRIAPWSLRVDSGDRPFWAIHFSE